MNFSAASGKNWTPPDGKTATPNASANLKETTKPAASQAKQNSFFCKMSDAAFLQRSARFKTCRQTKSAAHLP
jgi:hypothetical protein